MARLPIRPSTLKRLFALSGNLCAYPDCRQVLYREDLTGFVEVCHIHPAEKDWTRYDPDVSDEQLRDMSNLILLCRNHHGEVDQQFSEVPADELRAWKKKHEAMFSNMRALFNPQIVDAAGQRDPKPPQNLGRLLVSHSRDFTHGDLADGVTELTAFLARIRNVPPQTIEFMHKLLAHGLRGGHSPRLGGSGIRVNAEEVRQNFSLSTRQIQDFCAIMARYGLGDLDEDFQGHVVTINDPGDRVTWEVIGQAAEILRFGLEDLLQEQDFTVFDT